VWVDRAGAKIALQETYSRNSKGSLGLVLERVRSQAEPARSYCVTLSDAAQPRAPPCIETA